MDGTAVSNRGVSSQDLGAAVQLQPDRLVLLAGGNYSGRTRILRLLTGIPGWDENDICRDARTDVPRVYIGPEVYNAISGLAPTVQGELLLHTHEDGDQDWTLNLHHRLGLDALYERNPFTLSGGEQVCLAVAAGLSLGPSVIAVDCAVEQLDPETKEEVLTALVTTSQRTAAAMADNRHSIARGSHTVNVEDVDSLPPCRSDFDLAPVDAGIALPPPLGRTHGEPLSMAGLTFAYSKYRPVIRGVSGCLSPGELYYLCGRNGSGKSTLAKLLSGVLRPTAGEFLSGAVTVHPWKSPGRLVSYHFQNPDLQLFASTVEDELAASIRWLRVSSEEKTARLSAVLQAFGLDGVREEHPLDLPFVARKRVALAATIACGTPWVILDEPTLGQDDASAMAIAQIIRQLLALGVGVVVITHSQWFQEVLPGTQLMLDDGVISS